MLYVNAVTGITLRCDHSLRPLDPRHVGGCRIVTPLTLTCCGNHSIRYCLSHNLAGQGALW